METPLALALLGASWMLWMRQKVMSFALFGLVIFVRFELAVFTLAVILYSTLKGLYRPAAMGANLLLGVAPLCGYNLYFFGTLIPHSITAKSLVYQLNYSYAIDCLLSSFRFGGLVQLLKCASSSAGVPALEGIKALLATAAEDGVLSFVLDFLPATLAAVTVCVAISLFLRSPETSTPSSSGSSLVCLVIACGTVVAAMYIFKKVHLFPWYIPLYTVPMTWGIMIFSRIFNYKTFTIAVCIFLVFPLMRLPRTVYAALCNPFFHEHFGQGARVRKYIQVGTRLYEIFSSGVLLTSEIGGLGYGFGGKIEDGLGLVSPGALKYHPMQVPQERRHGSIGAIPVGYLKEVSPELIVSLDGFVEALLTSSEMERYVAFTLPLFVAEDLNRFSGEVALGKNKNLFVFIRKDLGPANVSWWEGIGTHLLRE
jgi:hypothetical protein